MLFPFLDQYVTAFNTVLASLGDFLISYFRHVVRHNADSRNVLLFKSKPLQTALSLYRYHC